MTVWQVQPLAKRYFRGAPSVAPLDRTKVGVRVGPPGRAGAVRVAPGANAPREAPGIVPALGWLLGGYAAVTALVAWALSTGEAEHGPIRALAPLSLFLSIIVGIGSLGVAVFAGRRYLVLAIGVLSLAVGVAVASAGALITASF